MEYPTEFDFKTNELFKPASDINLNACVGDNGGPYDLSFYGNGFFLGGNVIVAAVEAGNPCVDVLVYPAAFSYRHGIELYLKHLFQLLAEWNFSDPDYKRGHSMQALWSGVRPNLERVEGLKSADRLERAGELIGAFCEIDPKGEVFRYPEDLKGNRHLTELRIINLRVLGNGMRELHGYFVDWQYHLEALLDKRQSV